MPARRKASSRKKTTGRQKQITQKAGPAKNKGQGKLPTAEEIREKTPATGKKTTVKRTSPEKPAAKRVPKKSTRKTTAAGGARSVASAKTTAKQKTARNKRNDPKKSTGQQQARRKRDSAPAPTRARRQKATGKQAKQKRT